MPTFTVHAPRERDLNRAEIERVAFVPEGFSWAAFAFGPFWLLRHGLWRALAGWIVVMAILVALLVALKLGFTLPWITALVSAYLGLEGGTLRRAALARSGRDMVDVVTGPDQDACERLYFERCGLFDRAPSPVPAPRPGHGGPAPQGGGPIIGLFPQAGGRA